MGPSRTSRTFFLAVVFAMVALMATITPTHAQTADLLQKKITRLQAKASKAKGIIELDSNSFEEVMAKPRNYSMVVLFTAISPEFNCIPCLNFDPEYRIVAKGWAKQEDTSQLFFGVLDFKAGQAVFQKFGMNSAPSALFFPPSDTMSGVPVHDRYDFNKGGFQAEPFASWLNARAGTSLRVQRPFDFIAFSLKVLFVLAVVASAYVIYTRAGKVLGSKIVWCSVSMLTIFVMISGHMWNQIRHPPYTVPGRDGRPGFIAQGFQNQFGLETQLVAIMYAILSGSLIGLIAVVPRIEDPAKQRFAVWVGMGLVGFFFSVLMQFFRLKNPGYPFRLYF